MFFGVDIGGTNTKIGMVDATGRIVDRDTIKTSIYQNPADLVLTVAYTILRMANKVHHVSIDGIGVCCPQVSSEGTVENAANLHFKEKFSLRELFSPYFPDVPLAFDNDANAATIGEQVYGKAVGLNDFLFVTLGTGVGGGIVSNGKLVYGLNGMAGEVGHIIVAPNGRPCGCGRRGCLERYVAAPGAFETYLEICRNAGVPPKADNYRAMADLAKAGDEYARKTYAETGRYLGIFLANLACVTSPTHIFLFGGVTQVGEILLGPVRRHFNENLLYCYKNAIKIELSGLMSASADAAILGAVALVSQGH